MHRSHKVTSFAEIIFLMNDDSLYNVYGRIPMTKKLWASLNKKYNTEDVGAKKFVVGRFLEYNMVDRKIVIS